MLTLNLEQTQELIASVIKTHGEDKIYERPSASSCLYVHKDDDGNLTPGCLVGTALMEYGVAPESLVNQIMDANELAMYLKRREILSISESAVRYLVHAQQSQDDGHTWGEANENALAYIRGGMEDDD